MRFPVGGGQGQQGFQLDLAFGDDLEAPGKAEQRGYDAALAAQRGDGQETMRQPVERPAAVARGRIEEGRA